MQDARPLEPLVRRSWLKLATVASAAFACPSLAQAQTQGMAPTTGRPFPVEYYYKVRWGHGAEFIRLFRKNHYPLLVEQQRMGRILEIRAEQPFYHSVEEGRWDYRVTVVWKDAVVAHDDFDGAEIKRRLFPDEETFRREEQRRFELLLAHWDVVIEKVPLDPK
jgi:hypothetical protein